VPDPFYDVPNNLIQKPTDAERILSARRGCNMVCDPVEYHSYEPYYVSIFSAVFNEDNLEDSYD